MVYTIFEKCPITKVKVGVLHPVQQPWSYWERSSVLPLLGSHPCRGDNLGLDAKLTNQWATNNPVSHKCCSETNVYLSLYVSSTALAASSSLKMSKTAVSLF